MQRLFAAVLAAFALTACSSSPYWEKVEPEYQAKQIDVVIVDFNPWPSMNLEGWTTRGANGVCLITILRAAYDRACVERHERRHCGDASTGTPAVDHPKYPINHFGCRPPSQMPGFRLMELREDHEQPQPEKQRRPDARPQRIRYRRPEYA